jgi:hypothetical protein
MKQGEEIKTKRGYGLERKKKRKEEGAEEEKGTG